MVAHKFKTGDLVLFQTAFLDRRHAPGVYTLQIRMVGVSGH